MRDMVASLDALQVTRALPVMPMSGSGDTGLVTQADASPVITGSPQRPPRPPSETVELVEVDRSHRAVLENLGQLYRHDLSEAYRHLPNQDGTFNNRRLDLFRTDPERRAWLINVAGRLGGFVMTAPADQRWHHNQRLLRRTRTSSHRNGTRSRAASHRHVPGTMEHRLPVLQPRRTASLVTGGIRRSGRRLGIYDDPPVEGRPPDTWITFQT